MVRNKSSVVWPLALLLLLGAAQRGFAQQADDNGLRSTSIYDDEAPPLLATTLNRITIGDDENLRTRRRTSSADPYAQQGLSSGAFRLFPSLEIGSGISSNPKREHGKTKAAVALRLKPVLRLESNWSRHRFVGNASMDAEQFLGRKDLKSVGAELNGAFRLDIRRTTQAQINAGYSLKSIGIGSSGVPLTATGKRLDQVLSASSGVTHDFGGLEAGLRLGVSRNVFGDVKLVGGGSEDNSDRNYTEVSVAARAALKTGAIVEPFGEVAYTPRWHDKNRDRLGLKRNSQGLRLSAGVTIAEEPFWSGDVAATFDLRDYEDAALRTVSSPGVVANLTWRPTDLTRFEFNSGVSLAETIAAGDGATKTWTAGVSATHAIRENIDVTAGLRLTAERTAVDASRTSTASLGVNWTLNPMLVWSASYEGTWFNGKAAGTDYSDHRLLTSIIIRR
jgi:hypothetical protein